MVLRAGMVLLVTVAMAAWATGARADTTLLQDDFSGSALDPAKWTAEVSTGCSLTVSGGLLHSYFTGAGAARGAYAVSLALDLPQNWTSVQITGDWAFVTKVYGEMVLRVCDAEATGNLVQAGYKTYSGDAFRYSYTGHAAADTSRNVPATPAQFECTITPDHWLFRENRGSGWTTLVDLDTAIFADTESLLLRIGGWEYSATAMQHVTFDNINVTAVPEPATMGLLALGV
ncbi:MAG: hypothetical protein JXL80_03725, partial [Planctomycetes bacterium]|nr:hypothetical protein [Planctomycetota bacterium]